MICDGAVLSASLVAEGTGKPTLADTGRAGQQKPMTLADPVAACEFEEQGAIETAFGTEVGIFDLRVMAQPGRAGTGLEALLAPHRCFVLEQDGEPLAMIEGASFRLRVEILEAFGHTVQAEIA